MIGIWYNGFVCSGGEKIDRIVSGKLSAEDTAVDSSLRPRCLDDFIGQKKLKDAKVLVVGAGGLGSPVLLYLAAAGVGTIGVVDDDEVDNSNLQRQVIKEMQKHNSILVTAMIKA